MDERGESRGDADRLAPVIPLFGKNAPRGEETSSSPLAGLTESPGTDAHAWHSTWGQQPPKPHGEMNDAAEASIGLRAVDDVRSETPRSAGVDKTAPRLRALRPHDQTAESSVVDDVDPAQVREGAEELLVRKLRSKSLSISEARLILKGYESQGQRVDGGQIDDIIDDFCRRGYLDDAVLAAHLVISGAERKGQGRVALARALAQRGLPREVIDTALEELPDDDAERALEYARTKARSLARLDNDTALRRLVGQLARRGYNGSLAMSAAKKALAEASFGNGASGVRFVDSD